MPEDKTTAEEQAIFQDMVKEKSPELFCDACGFYPIEPVHGHFMCPSCHMVTKCCEGMPADV
jgi:hypothetical protein